MRESRHALETLACNIAALSTVGSAGSAVVEAGVVKAASVVGGITAVFEVDAGSCVVGSANV